MDVTRDRCSSSTRRVVGDLCRLRGGAAGMVLVPERCFGKTRRTKRAFCRHDTTGSGSDCEIWGRVSVDVSQVKGGAASAMVMRTDLAILSVRIIRSCVTYKDLVRGFCHALDVGRCVIMFAFENPAHPYDVNWLVLARIVSPQCRCVGIVGGEGREQRAGH